MRLSRNAIGPVMLGLCLPASALAQVETKVMAGTRQAADEFGIMYILSEPRYKAANLMASSNAAS